MFVEKNKISNSNKDIMARLLVEQAKAYLAKTGNVSLSVVAKKDDELAIHLMANALKAGLKPMLDETEYPKDDPKREWVLENAKKLIQMESEKSKKSKFSPFLDPNKKP
jgi:hypothetical protein